MAAQAGLTVSATPEEQYPGRSGIQRRSHQWAQGVTERYLPNVRLFAQGVMTNVGILHEPGHAGPWMIAMDCPPTRAAVLDYSVRWGIEPMFSDFKSRGFELENSQLRQTDRLEQLSVT